MGWSYARIVDGSFSKMVTVNRIDRKRLDVVKKDPEELKPDRNGNLDLA